MIPGVGTSICFLGAEVILVKLWIIQRTGLTCEEVFLVSHRVA